VQISVVTDLVAVLDDPPDEVFVKLSREAGNKDGRLEVVARKEIEDPGAPLRPAQRKPARLTSVVGTRSPDLCPAESSHHQHRNLTQRRTRDHRAIGTA
jgi:hypothetical protein